MPLYGSRGVHGQTVEAIARRVMSGELPEGGTLDLAELQTDLGISLTVLRESLKVLAAKGLVGARQKRGTFVRPRSDWNLLDADVMHWQYSQEADTSQLRNLNEVRRIVEPAAVRLAAQRRSDADLDKLEQALAAMAGADSPKLAVEADWTAYADRTLTPPRWPCAHCWTRRSATRSASSRPRTGRTEGEDHPGRDLPGAASLAILPGRN
jgi:DNA-binding FadR family transcriptional regulator